MSVVRLPASCRWLAVLGARAAVVWIVEAFFFLEGLGIEGSASPGTVFISGGFLTCAWWAESAGLCRCGRRCHRKQSFSYLEYKKTR